MTNRRRRVAKQRRRIKRLEKIRKSLVYMNPINQSALVAVKRKLNMLLY